MGRKKVEINPKCGERLSALLGERKMQQKTLAEALSYTPQQISRIIKGKDRLTEEFANKVIEFFKTADMEAGLSDTVRYEWLMCYDDFKTESDEWDAEHARSTRIEIMWETLLDKIAHDAGYKLERRDIKSKDFLQRKESYFFTDSTGHTTGFSWFDTETSDGRHISGIQSFQNDLFAFAAFQLKRMIQQKSIEFNLDNNDGGNENG